MKTIGLILSLIGCSGLLIVIFGGQIGMENYALQIFKDAWWVFFICVVFGIARLFANHMNRLPKYGTITKPKRYKKIRADYLLIGLVIILLTSLGLQFRLDWGWLVWVSTITPVIFIWLVGKKTANPVVNVLSLILFCVWTLFFTLIVIMGLPFQTEI